MSRNNLICKGKFPSYGLRSTTRWRCIDQPRTAGMKKGYHEELSKRKKALEKTRGDMEVWYATHSRVKDEEMPDKENQKYGTLVAQAESSLADYTGFLKNLKQALDSLLHFV